MLTINKINRPQSAIVMKEMIDNGFMTHYLKQDDRHKGTPYLAFTSHINSMTEKVISPSKYRVQSQKAIQNRNQSGENRVSYDYNTVISNKSSAMKLGKLFSDDAIEYNSLFNFKYSKLKNAPMKISNMITMSEKTKKQDLSKMSKEEYLSLMIKKLNEFDDFMKVENHKRWFRNGNPELTSSLIRSQINMIRNTFGLNSQK